MHINLYIYIYTPICLSIGRTIENERTNRSIDQFVCLFPAVFVAYPRGVPRQCSKGTLGALVFDPMGVLVGTVWGTQGALQENSRVLKAYSRRTQGVPKAYSRGTPGVLQGYSRGTPRYSRVLYGVLYGVLQGHSFRPMIGQAGARASSAARRDCAGVALVGAAAVVGPSANTQSPLALSPLHGAGAPVSTHGTPVSTHEHHGAGTSCSPPESSSGSRSHASSCTGRWCAI